MWKKKSENLEAAQKEWKKLSAEGFDLRDELVHIFRYAFRTESDTLKIINRIAQGRDTADMIQDLNDLSVLVRDKPEKIIAVGADPEKAVYAGVLSGKLGDLRYLATGGNNASEAKIVRDQMYTLLKGYVDAIRACGKFVFWKDAEKVKEYSSPYFRQN